MVPSGTLVPVQASTGIAVEVGANWIERANMTQQFFGRPGGPANAATPRTGNSSIPAMASVPGFSMPRAPNFDPTKYQANPYLAQMGNSITSQVTENLQRNIMPGISSNAVAAGGFGGSRQGVIEANALRDANKSIGDSLTGMYFGDYTNAMNRNLQRYGMDQNFNLGSSQLGLNAQNSARNYNLGVGQLALGNKNSDQSYELGQGQLQLGKQNSMQNFYTANRGQDLQQIGLGASLFNQGNQGFLSQGQGIYGLGSQQQQAPWQVVNNGNAGFGQWSGYGTTTSANTGGGAQGMLGGALAGGQFGNLWGAPRTNSAGNAYQTGAGTMADLTSLGVF